MSPRVLVVDDEPRIVSFVSRALSAEGFRVEAESEGRRALERVRKRAYDLVVLDLLMPGTDGHTILEGMIEARPDQRVMILSAVSSVDSKVKCLEAGAVDYLPKPFSVAELMARVRARLREPGAAPPTRFMRVGAVVLDMARRSADAGEGPVSLSEREFLLLQHLMRMEGDVCTRARLLEEVWGYSFPTSSNVVDVYVGRLRAKLGPDAIETVRNAGYRFNAP